ncbi:SDR family oxidoreductase [Nocardia caishijiensis]|uniref:3-oxoacyl-[acyl-carrier-protein] reductase MabA n=1 Tax=Nocardia caishijiensis TaxID=184756 RepID=A0ABQ6YMW8_9NOCA|nr:SDR family oxidoreductase [Nocardia caishijiensis]KAF0847118.1 NAD(P)-dependent dehydrogenase (short-subunit alcohol dehydrogenase family) [Nocardia caishijiensis]
MVESTARRVVLVTGASRGIGAETARQFGATGAHVLVNFREKRKRAETVVTEIVTAGGSASAIGADVSKSDDVAAMAADIQRTHGRLDVLVLNASGGLERDADPGYALRLNRDAQVDLATAMLPLMPSGGRIVFVTSHQAHFIHEQSDVPAGYTPIARSKRAGEDALRALMPEFRSRGVGFTVVSGDMIDGTIIVRLLERRDASSVASRRAAGPLPTVEDFAAAIVTAAESDGADGRTVYVGGADYLTSTAAGR